ncbi:MAG: sulfatase-like hydrolase/transferase, partial [Lachnospiraceae bacterium]|nr:sulfatase-like hydrolase/transferase [Lachnospiraceae bacterium]
ATYHTRYSSWKANRGQEGDACTWDAEIVEYTQKLGRGVTDPRNMKALLMRQDAVTRSHITDEMDMPQAVNFRDGLDFLERNAGLQDWFLQIENFDPHEPFFTQPQWKELYPEIAEYLEKKAEEMRQDPSAKMKNDWPPYDSVRDDSPEDIRYVRNLYAALVSMCDFYLGKVLDFMDAHDMWKDTMLIVNTDHGFLLGEHEWWGKNIMPAYEEISHTPLFIYDPVSGIKGERRSGLTSALDLPVTILEFFGIEVPKDMQGYSLLPLIRENRTERKAALFGFNGSTVSVTDGEYVYFRAPLASQENNVYEYTLMPARMRQMFSVADLQKAELVPPLPNSKGCPVLKTHAGRRQLSPLNFGTKLYKVTEDPRQKAPVDDAKTEARMARLLKEEMEKAAAPEEQFVRLGLAGEITSESVLSQREAEEAEETPQFIPGAKWTKEANNILRAFEKSMAEEEYDRLISAVKAVHSAHPDAPVSYADLAEAVRKTLPEDRTDQTVYYMYLVSRAE